MNVVDRVRVGGAPQEVQLFDGRQCRHRVLLSSAVQDVAHQATGEFSVSDLGDGSQRPGKTQFACQDLCQLHGRGADQPHLLPGGEMFFGEFPGAGPNFFTHVSVHDFLAQAHKFVHGPPLDEFQGLLSPLRHIVGVFRSGDAEFYLLPHHGQDFPEVEVAFAGESRGKHDEGGALNEGVVDVEKRGGTVVLGDVGVGGAHVPAPGGFKSAGHGFYTGGEVAEV